jgi:hypothetical protein
MSFKQCINFSNQMQLQEFDISLGFVILCVKGFTYSSLGCILNEHLCVNDHRAKSTLEKPTDQNFGLSLCSEVSFGILTHYIK